MSIGIYSGTFDPIHEGHILFAEVAAEQFGLDKILFLPEPKPRYKNVVASVDNRQVMCELAANSIEVDTKVHVFDPDASHTLRGELEKIAELYPDDEYFMMMGADVFKNINSWGSRDDEDGGVAEVATKIGFIVGITSLDEVEELKKVAEVASLNVRFVEVPLKTMSSSKIREKIKNENVFHGLNDDVVKYIKLEELYGAK